MLIFGLTSSISIPYFSATYFTWSFVAFISNPVLKNTYLIGGSSNITGGLSDWQKKGVPLSIAQEYDQAEDKEAKRKELKERYPKCESLINFLMSYDF